MLDVHKGLQNSRANEAPPPNRRLRSPLDRLGQFEDLIHAQPAFPAAVGEARRSAARV